MNALKERALKTKGLLVAASVLASGSVLAHPGHEQASSFMTGFAHPMGGLDHLLAMVAIGLWAASIGGRALWAIPAAFVVTMLLGGGLAVAGLNVPFVEQGILLSVIVLGALVLFAKRLPTAVCVMIAGGFALFHGAAHGMEMPLNANGLQYALGFALATASLHLVGLGLGQLMTKIGTSSFATRISGFVIATAGLLLAFV
ncbi:MULTISPECIES: HupE/UreJ family protein [unclassified Marinomonas]|uniref:HupE/UreJ family protein n=1 Tax=unclassified Marinomonas TaxID=196814 RepID=UPI000C1EC02C|nr:MULTISPECIES: HupE/UreJ family protein [unclassified Marinomonas]PJE55574.1 urease accessory protein UreJ [Marinomonas sp. BSi20584]